MNNIDFLSNEEVATFIKENIKEDVGRLLLNPPSPYHNSIRLIADQILARQKAKGKLDDWVANSQLVFPPPLSIEQASSTITGNYKKGLIEGSELIDLTGGTGIDCLTLSESFTKTTYVEESKQLCEVFDHNQKVLGRNIRVINDDAESYLRSYTGKATLYLDPARRKGLNHKVFQLDDCSPNILELLELLDQKSNLVLIKLSPLIDIHDTVHRIPNIKEVHVVSIRNDCKEVLLILDNSQTSDVTMYAVNLGTDQQPFSFLLKEEQTSKVRITDLAKYLYEPNSSILKAGAFKTLGTNFRLDKLATNTHLYTSNTWIRSFPGKQFQVLSTDVKADLKKYAPEGKINVLTRNYAIRAPELKKKYRLKDGGDYYLLGFRDQNQKPKLAIAKRIDVL